MTFHRRSTAFRERELAELADNCREECEALEHGRAAADTATVALQQRQLEVLAKVEDLGQWEKELINRDWVEELRTPRPAVSGKKKSRTAADGKQAGGGGAA